MVNTLPPTSSGSAHINTYHTSVMLLKGIMQKQQSKVPIISGSFYQTSTLISYFRTQVAMTVLLSGNPVLTWMSNIAMTQTLVNREAQMGPGKVTSVRGHPHSNI